MRLVSLRIVEAAPGLLIAAECVVNALRRGIMFSPDARLFVRMSDELLAHHWNIFHVYQALSNKLPLVPYTTLPVLIAIAKTVAPQAWPALIVAVNAVATACAGVLTFRIAHRHAGPAGGWIAAAGFLACVDIIDWSRFILTDSLYLGLATLAVYLMIEGRLRAAAAVILIALFTRPTAPHLLVPFAIVLLATWRRADLRRLTGRFMIALPFLLLALMGVLALLAQRHTTLRLTSFAISLYERGVVIIDRPETWTRGGTGYGDLLWTLLRRLLAFFSVTAKGFSRAHTLINALYYLPLYAAAIAGIAALFARRVERETAACVALITLCTIWIAHALIIIDFDWRYRLPTIPLLLILAATATRFLPPRPASSPPPPRAAS